MKKDCVRKMHMSLGRLLLCCISLSGIAVAQTAWQPLESDGKIRVIAHRGEQLQHPENTLAAFQAAIDVGADYFSATEGRQTVDPLPSALLFGARGGGRAHLWDCLSEEYGPNDYRCDQAGSRRPL